MSWLPRKQDWTRSARVFEDDANPLKRSLDVVIGSQNYQEVEAGEWLEIDVTLVPNPIAGWDWGMLKANYEAAFREDVTADWVAIFRSKLRPNLWIRFKPIALLYCNDEGKREVVATPQDGAVFEIVDNKAVWRDAFGTGLDLTWWCTNTRLQKTVTIPSVTSLPMPTIGGTNRCLALAMRFDFSPDIDAFIEGNKWNKQQLKESLEHIHFRESPLADIAFSIICPRAWDSAEAHLEEGEEQPGPHIRACSHEYRRQGDDLIIAVKLPLAWATNPAVVWPIYIDAVVDQQVSAGNCDAHEHDNDTGFDATADYVDMLSAPITSQSYTSGFVFLNVAIPNSQALTVAYMELYIYEAGKDEPWLAIQGNDVDSANNFTDEPDITNRARTTALVQWLVGGGVGLGWAQTPSIIAPIEEVLARGGWASGNNLCLLFDGYTSAHYFRARSYEYDSAKAAKLHIEYIGGNGGQPIGGPGNAHMAALAMRLIG